MARCRLFSLASSWAGAGAGAGAEAGGALTLFSMARVVVIVSSLTFLLRVIILCLGVVLLPEMKISVQSGLSLVTIMCTTNKY